MMKLIATLIAATMLTGTAAATTLDSTDDWGLAYSSAALANSLAANGVSNQHFSSSSIQCRIAMAQVICDVSGSNAGEPVMLRNLYAGNAPMQAPEGTEVFATGDMRY